MLPDSFLALLPLWLPILASPLVYILRRRAVTASLLTVGALSISSYLLWTQPPAATTFLGRPFELTRLPRVVLVALGIWMIIGALYSARISQGWSVFPFWLVSFSILSGAFMFQDFLIRVLILKIAWLVAILLVQSGTATETRAGTRLLIVSVLALPAFLFASVIIDRFALQPEALALAQLAGIGLGLGFSLMLAVFPFHAWLPQAAEDGPPLIAAWLVAALGTSYIVLLIDMLSQYPWLLVEGNGETMLRAAGVILAIGAGILVFTETHLGRMWAYSVLSDLGYLLLALSFGGATGVQAALLVTAARFVALALSGTALATIRHRVQTLEIDKLAGSASQVPLSYLGFLAGGLAFFGLPLSPGFPGHWVVIRELLTTAPVWVWAMVGAALLGTLGYVRALNAAFQTAPQERLDEIEREPLSVGVILLTLIAVAVSIGLAPGTIMPLISFLLESLRF